MNDKEILKKQDKSISFLICFDRLVNDLIDASELLNEYLLNDRFIENYIEYHEAQEALASTFNEKMDRINYNVKLIDSKKINGRLRSIKEYNDMIESLFYDIIPVAGKLRGGWGDTEEKEKAKPLYEKITVGLETLEKVIFEYNKKAQKSHIGKLITVALAREKAIQTFTKALQSFDQEI